MSTERILKTVLSTFIPVLLAAVVPANAHHGWGFYGDIVELEFTVEELKLGNPHDRVVALDDKNQKWNLLLCRDWCKALAQA